MPTKLLIVTSIMSILTGVGYGLYSATHPERLTNNALTSPIVNTIHSILPQAISLPPPLRFFTHQSSPLTPAGIIAQTNKERGQKNAIALSQSAKLTTAAQIKLDGLFARQYFEHVSPNGKGPADLATASGYAYLRIGENLALGNFEGDVGVVTAWMNSPGHRANILAAGYREIGVATREDTYEGQRVWIAVQEFGTPQSLCPEPEVSVKAKIDQLQNQITTLQKNLATQKKTIDTTYAAWKKANDDGDSEGANALADQLKSLENTYNTAVGSYNQINNELGNLAQKYNVSVNAYNNCTQKFK